LQAARNGEHESDTTFTIKPRWDLEMQDTAGTMGI